VGCSREMESTFPVGKHDRQLLRRARGGRPGRGGVVGCADPRGGGDSDRPVPRGAAALALAAVRLVWSEYG
jgi:hypothetical protein